MNNYLEFTHDQSNWITGTTFTDVSENSRILTFEIITKDFFVYDGWYSYSLYEDYTKIKRLDYGKCYLKSDNKKTIYTNSDNKKTIYKR